MENHDEWERWRGHISMKVEAHQAKLDDHCDRLVSVEERVGQILVKLAVPLFLIQLVGVGIGGVIVALLTRGMR